MKLALGAFRELSDDTLNFVRQLGVPCVHLIGSEANFASARQGGDSGPMHEKPSWDYWDVLRLKARIESFGLELAALSLPGNQFENILYWREGKERDLENVCTSIQVAGMLGIPVVPYSFSIASVWGHWRNYRSGGGRGNAGIKSFDYRHVIDAPLTEAGEVTAGEMWERLTYLLEGIIPVAEQAGVHMACHPHDSPAPVLRGVARILGSVEGLQRLCDTVPSDYNGLLFCQGSVQEMGVDILQAIRQFASQGKIFHVQFRNVRGVFPSFDEVFIDEGDTDMLAALRVYKECGYPWTLRQTTRRQRLAIPRGVIAGEAMPSAI